MGRYQRLAGDTRWERAGLGVAAFTLAAFCGAVVLSAVSAGDARLDWWDGQTQVWSVVLGGLGVSVRLARRASRPARVPPEVADQACRELAKAVLRSESAQRSRLLGTDHPDTRTVDVGFRREAEPGEPAGPAGPPPDGTDDGAGSATVPGGGWLSSILEYFHRVPSSRLVILGEPGAGKTVLAVELLVRLLEERARHEDSGSPARPGPVPVRFNLATWPTGLYSFERWLAAELRAGYQLDPAVAAALVADRRILPVLDGLDEMDPDDGRNRRATAALRMLNDEYLAGSSRAPVILTCREARFAALSRTSDRLGGVLEGAECIRIEPLNVRQIRSYLEGAMRTRAARDRWTEVLAGPAAQPDSTLVPLLETPWRLVLAATVCRAGAEPAELARTASGHDAAVRFPALLLSRFTASATALYPRTTRSGAPHPNPYTAAQVTGWLTFIAAHLATQGAVGRSGVDLVPHELWRADARRIRILHGALCLTIAAVLYLVSVGVTQTCSFDPRRWIEGYEEVLSVRPGPPGSNWLDSALSDLVFFPVLLAPVAVAGWSRRQAPRRVAARALRRRRGRSRFARGLLLWSGFGVLAGVLIGVLVGIEAGGDAAQTYALNMTLSIMVFGLIAGITTGINARAAAAATPYEPLRQDLVYGAVCAACLTVLGLTGDWAVSVLTNSSAVFSETAAHFWLTNGLALWATVGVGYGFTWFGRACVRYRLALAVLAARRSLPPGLGAFLDWAHGAGLLRTSGTAYQFRHREFQDWLFPLPPQSRSEPVPAAERTVRSQP